MSEKRLFKFVHAQARRLAAEFCMTAPDGWVAKFSQPTRTLDQNSAQWPILQAFAEQLQWPINGRMEWITDEDWKDILTAAFRQELARVAPGINGGMVLLGARTSQFKVKEFSDWIEFLHATAVDRGVVVYQDEAA